MPGLPDRPDLDQLRHQARELLRAALAGDPAAIARIGAVSARPTLSAAQQALARDYGYRNWAELRAEVERRRSPLARWSFGGAISIETASGPLLLEALVVGEDEALLFTTLTPAGVDPLSDDATAADGPDMIDELIRDLHTSAGTDGITVTDDRGAAYALSLRAASGGRDPAPKSVWLAVEPAPGPQVEWIELGGFAGTTARLLRSPRAAVRLGRLTPLVTPPPDAVRVDTVDLPDSIDWPRHHLDLGVTLPTLDGIALDLDSLFSTYDGWSLRLRATPRWWRYRDNGNRKWSPVQITAEDDLGRFYSATFGGSAGRDGHEYLSLQFTPHLAPAAGRLRLTCATSAQQISVEFALPAAD